MSTTQLMNIHRSAEGSENIGLTLQQKIMRNVLIGISVGSRSFRYTGFCESFSRKTSE